ncbi:ABC transporter permease [Chloroflexi bacterium TSY]|nr:ABC transporter permease [Chloroflexi bacterium TSY]
MGIIDKVTGWGGIWDQRIILPVLVLAINPAGRHPANESRSVRGLAAIICVLLRPRVTWSSDSVATHSQNALTPVVTTLSFRLGTILTGAFFIETIFGIPGFGEQAFRSLRSYDYPLLMGTTLIGAAFIIAANFVADIAYAFLDPRYERELA